MRPHDLEHHLQALHNLAHMVMEDDAYSPLICSPKLKAIMV